MGLGRFGLGCCKTTVETENGVVVICIGDVDRLNSINQPFSNRYEVPDDVEFMFDRNFAGNIIRVTGTEESVKFEVLGPDAPTPDVTIPFGGSGLLQIGLLCVPVVAELFATNPPNNIDIGCCNFAVNEGRHQIDSNLQPDLFENFGPFPITSNWPEYTIVDDMSQAFVSGYFTSVDSDTECTAMAETKSKIFEMEFEYEVSPFDLQAGGGPSILTRFQTRVTNPNAVPSMQVLFGANGPTLAVRPIAGGQPVFPSDVVPGFSGILGVRIDCGLRETSYRYNGSTFLVLGFDEIYSLGIASERASSAFLRNVICNPAPRCKDEGGFTTGGGAESITTLMSWNNTAVLDPPTTIVFRNFLATFQNNP